MKSKCFLLVIVFLLFAMDIAVLFNIPVARQVIGFLCLTFVPGFIIFKLLKLDNFDFLESTVFSVGFSVAFLILAGLFTNEFAFTFGVSQPISQLPLLIVVNSFIMMGGVLVYLKSRNGDVWTVETVKVSPFMILFICLPILSIVGTVYASTFGSNLLLLVTLTLVSVLFAVGTVSKKVLPSDMYPFALLMIAIALLFQSSLYSQYIVPFGSDVPGEYIVFKTSENMGLWISNYLSSNWYGRMNAMLSITILPTFYVNILGIDFAWVKVLFPLLFSIVPLGLYKVWQTYIAKKYAFISAFLFIAFEPFYTEMLGLNRQIIAELFFVLLLLVIVNSKMKPFNKTASFVIFSFGLVASHYALAEIFVFFLASAFFILVFLKRPSRKITISMIILFFAIMFAWYIYTSGSATFSSILEDGGRVYQQLGNFFNPASRGETVLAGLGMAESPSIWNTVSRVFAYFTQLLIVLGIFSLVRRRSKIHFGREWFLFSLTAMVLLAMLIVVPGLANTLNMTRFYHILLFFLAPLCVVGAEFVVMFLLKRKRKFAVSLLLLFVLVPYFLFQTEFVFEVTKSNSWSIPLSGYRMSAIDLYGKSGYTDAHSAYGARWFTEYIEIRDTEIYADTSALSNILRIHSMVYGGSPLSNTTEVGRDGVVYLSTLNVVYGIVPFGRDSFNSRDLSFVFNDLNTVYANGGSEIYRQIP